MEGIFWCLDPTLPHNSGAFERFKFKLREGSVTGVPVPPVGTSVATDFTADRMASCAIALMAKIDPDKGGGEGGYVNWGDAVLSGKDYRHNDAPYVDQLIVPGVLAGGGPGGKGHGSWLSPTTQFAAGCQLFRGRKIRSRSGCRGHARLIYLYRAGGGGFHLIVAAPAEDDCGDEEDR